MSRVTETFAGSTVRIAGSVVLLLGVLVALGVVLGVFGVPGVAGVQNSFGPVNNSTTTIETTLVVSNPNPIGVSLGGTTINYTVFMNDVTMASGQKEGVQVERGNSSLDFTTYMRNERIPNWWYSHIENDERTQVRIDARVRSSTLGGKEFALPQNKQVETDIISQFNSEQTRAIDANRPLVDDPVLFVNETSAAWNDAELSRDRTPINMSFAVYNPKPWPYAVSEIGYTITMNDITVGEGSSEDVATVLPGTTERLQTQTAMRNQNLDEWWVSHLERNQVTDLRIDFYLVVDAETPGVGEFRIPLDPVDYQRTIETDLFGTKTGTAGNGTSGGDDTDSTTPTPDEEESTTGSSATTTASSTTTTTDDGGVLGGDSASATPTDSGSETPTATPTDDGGLLG